MPTHLICRKLSQYGKPRSKTCEVALIHKTTGFVDYLSTWSMGLIHKTFYNPSIPKVHEWPLREEGQGIAGPVRATKSAPGRSKHALNNVTVASLLVSNTSVLGAMVFG